MVSERQLKRVIMQFYLELHEKLPLENNLFCAMLFTHNLLPMNNRERINVLGTRADKVAHFMNNIVLCGVQTHLPNLLKVMKICDDNAVKALAEDIETMIGSGRIYLMFLHVKIHYNDIS